MRLSLDDSAILWPGRLRTKPEGFMIPTHLKVLTIAEKPFVYVRETKDAEKCNPDEIPCPHFNSTDDREYSTFDILLLILYRQKGVSCILNPSTSCCPAASDSVMYCCRGFCMDLLQELAKTINFTYSLALSPDGMFGNYVIRNTTVGGKKEWTGLIGELVNERADMIVAPLTINPERAEFIEFSKPFKYQGITILEKKPSRSSTLVSFLQPFSNTLWILVMVSVHVVALVLYLLDRFSPFGRFKLANTDGTEEDALNLSSAIWFAWGVLLNSGIGEGESSSSEPDQASNSLSLRALAHSGAPRRSPCHRYAAQLLGPRAGHGVGRLRHDHRRLVHCQLGRLPRAGAAKDQTDWHQRRQGELPHAHKRSHTFSNFES